MNTEHSLATEQRWTMGQQMERRRADQARVRLEAEVRGAARKRGASRAEAEALAQQSRVAFAIVNGEARAVAADGKTALMGATGASLLTIEEWVAKLVPEAARASTLGPSAVPLPSVARNPWRRASWNLTEQMRVLRRDPEQARALRDAAAAE
jgi:hypothetical protein